MTTWRKYDHLEKKCVARILIHFCSVHSKRMWNRSLPKLQITWRYSGEQFARAYERYEQYLPTGKQREFLWEYQVVSDWQNKTYKCWPSCIYRPGVFVRYNVTSSMSDKATAITQAVLWQLLKSLNLRSYSFRCLGSCVSIQSIAPQQNFTVTPKLKRWRRSEKIGLSTGLALKFRFSPNCSMVPKSDNRPFEDHLKGAWWLKSWQTGERKVIHTKISLYLTLILNLSDHK